MNKSAANWKRIKVKNGTARVTKNCPKYVENAINLMCVRLEKLFIKTDLPDALSHEARYRPIE